MSGLYRAIIRSMGARYLVYIVQFSSLMLLSRWFTPEIFGVVASVQVFYIFFQLLADGGLAPAIVGMDKITEEDRDGIFGLSLIAAVILAAIFFFLTPVFVRFYRIQELSITVPYLACGLFFYAATIFPAAILQRQQFFYAIAVSNICAEVLSLAIVFYLRYKGLSLHAVSARLMALPIINFICLYYFVGRTEFGRPMLGTKFSAIRSILRVTSYQFAFNFVNYFSRNFDTILVGRYLGVSPLGIYDKAYALMKYPLQLLTFAMAPAIQPALRKHAGDTAYIFRVNCDMASKLAWLGSFVAVLFYIFADKIVIIAFGSQWVGVVPVIRVLCLFIPVQVILASSGGIFQTFLRTDLMFKCGLFAAITNIVASIVGVKLGGLISLSWCLFVSFHINFVQTYYVMHRYVFGQSLIKFVFKCWPMFVAVGGLVTYDLKYGA